MEKNLQVLYAAVAAATAYHEEADLTYAELHEARLFLDKLSQLVK